MKAIPMKHYSNVQQIRAVAALLTNDNGPSLEIVRDRKQNIKEIKKVVAQLKQKLNAK